MPTLSRRAAAVPASPIRKLVPYADAAKARGLHVHHLNIGQPDIETPELMRRGLAELRDPVIAYGPSAGDAAMQQMLATYYRGLGVDCAPSEVLVTTGGSEAVLFALAACLDVDDEVLIPDPMYANYIGFAAVLGTRVVPVPTRVEEGYHLPAGRLAGYVTPRTRAVLLCNPSNPTGAVYTEAEVQAVIDLCVEHDLFLIADEVYREFVYDGPMPRSVLTYAGLGDRAIVVDSLSKRYSLCGGRVGCLISRNRDVMAAGLRLAQARLSPPALGQLVGARAALLDPGYFAGVRAEYARRRNVVYAALSSMPGVTVHRPEGAFYAMARLPVPDAERFVIWMLESFSRDGRTTMVAPGSGFYATPGAGMDEVRIAYVLEESALGDAMDLLAEGLKAFPG